MKEILKIIKKLTLSLIAIVVCLVAQALLDLSLPGYTSDIVNNGITGYGIKNNAPIVIRKSEYIKLLLFIDDKDKNVLNSNYSLVDSNNTNYVNDYPLLKTEELYLINDNIDSKTQKELNAIFKTPIIIMSNINNNKMEISSDSLEYLDNNQITNIVSKINSIDESIVTSLIKDYLKNEYKIIGIDTDKLQINYIIFSGLKMLSISLIIVLIAVIIGYLSSKVSAKFGSLLREKIVTKVMNYGEKELKEFSVASLITRTTNDIQNVQSVLAFGFRSIFFAPIMGIGAFIRVYNSTNSMSWVLGIGIAAVVIVILILLLVVLPKTKKMQKLIDKVNLIGREILTGLPVIRTFKTEDYEEKRFDIANNDLTKTNLFVNKMMSMMGPTMNFIMSGMGILIVWVGGFQVANGSIGIGDLLALIQYSMHVIFSFLIVALLSISLPRTIVSLKRLGEILNKEVSVKNPKRPKKFPKNIRGEIEFKKVSFKYPDAEIPTLNNLSFKASKGETIAIIGSTGSGKSTLVNLIPRFFDVTEGEILIDGVDIRDVDQKELRSKIGYVPQKGILFSGTIESNIKFGNENADLKQIENAAEIAQAKNFIIDKEDGYNSMISQGGKNVSGGQKQRLSIARAICFNPEIYIFDDSFSALDYKTDSQLRKSLREVTKDSTIIIVTQRVSTIMYADKIIVLNEGEVVGKGTHKELLKNCDVYKEIASSQLSKEELA